MSRATNNLFQMIRGHHDNRITNTVDTIAQLDKIQQFVSDLREVTAELKKEGHYVVAST